MDNGQEGPPTSMNLASPENFSQVAFPIIQHYYPLNTDIECHFQIVKGFQAGSRDWIGIFKVGWKTTNEYYTWISASSSGTGHVLFKAYYLPKDDEFYQFCYVDNSGEVRGVSVPFQLRAEENNEGNNEFVLMTTEEEIEKMNEEKRMLEEEKEAQANVIQMLQAAVRNTSEKNKTLEKENQDLHVQVKSLEEETESLKKNTFEELEQYKNKVQNLLSTINQMETWKEKMEAENQELKHENMANQLAIEITSSLKEDYAKQKAELEATVDTLKAEKKLKAEIQHLLDEESTKLVNEENKSKELQTQLISTREKMAALEEKVESLERENVMKGEEKKALCAKIAHLEFEVTALRDGSKEQLRLIETETKEKGRLEDLVERQNNKLMHAEDKLQELQTQLKTAKQNTTTLEQKVALLENENKKKTQDIRALETTLEHRQEEFENLKAAHLRGLEETEELNRQLRQTQLTAATSPARSFPPLASGLYYGNPYEDRSSILSENEPFINFGPTSVQEIRQPPSILQCPFCAQVFASEKYQVYQDHVMCHTSEESAPSQQPEMKCEICHQFLGDKQMYDDHMMCHRLQDNLEN